MRFFLSALCVTVIPFLMAARGRADFYINETVFVRPNAAAKVDEKPVDISTVPVPAQISKRDGDWYWLEKAWVHKKDLMNARAAVEYYTEQTQLRPTEAVLWRNLGMAWNHAQTQQDREFALKSLNESLRLDPKDPHTWQTRGNIMAYERKYDEAIKDLTEAIRLSPADAELYQSRASAGNWKGDHEQALADYSQAIKLDPQEPSYYRSRQYLLYRVGDLDGFLNDAMKIVQMCQSGRIDLATEPDPRDFGRAYQDVARIRSTFPDDKYHDGKQAVEYATKAYEAISGETKKRGFEEPDPAAILAAAYAEAGNFDEALKWNKHALKWLQKEPNNYEGSPEWEKEKADYNARLNLYKNHKPYRDSEQCQQIAWAKATCPIDKYRDGKRALELATKACELAQWKDRTCLETYAAAWAETGDFAKAMEWQQKAMELAPEGEAPERQNAGSEEALELYRQNKPLRDR